MVRCIGKLPEHRLASDHDELCILCDIARGTDGATDKAPDCAGRILPLWAQHQHIRTQHASAQSPNPSLLPVPKITMSDSTSGVRVRDPQTEMHAEDIIDINTGPLGLTVVHARVPIERTAPLQIALGTPNDDIIFDSDAAELRGGGVLSIDVTDQTTFEFGPRTNPLRLRGADGIEAALDHLARHPLPHRAPSPKRP